VRTFQLANWNISYLLAYKCNSYLGSLGKLGKSNMLTIKPKNPVKLQFRKASSCEKVLCLIKQKPLKLALPSG